MRTKIFLILILSFFYLPCSKASAVVTETEFKAAQNTVKNANNKSSDDYKNAQRILNGTFDL
ncbi:MAG TPA: hypothetical protein PLQ36_03940, partial [Candidatus Gracilibacteria bacterium]|nr:hypothetical protein [Candidatus Gracilibacteria bacterium]